MTSTANGEDLGVNTKDGANQDNYLRICQTCRQILQRRYDQLCFKTAGKDEVFDYYEVKLLKTNFEKIFFIFFRKLLQHERNWRVFSHYM